MPLPFEFIGDSKWLEDGKIAEFAEAATSHGWVGRGPGRVVITSDLAGDMQRFMTVSMFNRWMQRQRARHEGSGAMGVGMSFVAHDGIRTSVVAEVGTEVTLSLYAHEYLEAATDERLAVSGLATEPAGPEANHARALWGEYVVERVRREIFNDLGWPITEFDNSELVAAAGDAARGRRGPNEAWLYTVLALTYSKTLAHADAGVMTEAAALDHFYRMSLATPAWHRFGQCMREAYADPAADPALHDDATFQAWSDLWTTRR